MDLNIYTTSGFLDNIYTFSGTIDGHFSDRILYGNNDIVYVKLAREVSQATVSISIIRLGKLGTR